MSDVVERFMRYVQVDSQSNPNNEAETPSNPKEFDMSNMLAEDLKAIGCEDVNVDEHAYVTATVPASQGAEDLPALGLIAHVDASYDAPADGVKPHIVKYEGGDLVAGVVNGKTIASTPEEIPDLEKLVGQEIICSDGTTLLSADDKAGVAEIVSAVKRVIDDPSLPHPTLKIAFVPDEEIGHGASLLDIQKFGAAWAYTVDGEALGEFNYETFNASSATVRFHGVTVHPGSAKDIMINAITVASEFQQMVPQAERPEHTENYDGFFHPMSIKGTNSELELDYIIRDHDAKKFAHREQQLVEIAAFLNNRYGEGTVEVEIKESYRNMVEKLDGLDFLIDNALEAHRMAGVTPICRPVRGGTDGAQLSFRGLPCPNIATGAYNFHSIREFVPVQAMEKTVEILVNLIGLFAVPQK